MNYQDVLNAVYQTEAMKLFSGDETIHRTILKQTGLGRELYIKCLDAPVLFLSHEILEYRRLITDITCFDCVPSPLAIWRYL